MDDALGITYRDGFAEGSPAKESARSEGDGKPGGG